MQLAPKAQRKISKSPSREADSCQRQPHVERHIDQGLADLGRHVNPMAGHSGASAKAATGPLRTLRLPQGWSTPGREIRDASSSGPTSHCTSAAHSSSSQHRMAPGARGARPRQPQRRQAGQQAAGGLAEERGRLQSPSHATQAAAETGATGRTARSCRRPGRGTRLFAVMRRIQT